LNDVASKFRKEEKRKEKFRKKEEEFRKEEKSMRKRGNTKTFLPQKILNL